MFRFPLEIGEEITAVCKIMISLPLFVIARLESAYFSVIFFHVIIQWGFTLVRLYSMAHLAALYIILFATMHIGNKKAVSVLKNQRRIVMSEIIF